MFRSCGKGTESRGQATARSDSAGPRNGKDGKLHKTKKRVGSRDAHFDKFDESAMLSEGLVFGIRIVIADYARRPLFSLPLFLSDGESDIMLLVGSRTKVAPICRGLSKTMANLST